MWSDAIGGTITEAVRVRVERAAELAVIAEMTRAAFMRGAATAGDVVKSENLAGRAEKALRLDRAGEAGRSASCWPTISRQAGAADDHRHHGRRAARSSCSVGRSMAE